MKIIQHEIFDQNESLLKTRAAMRGAKEQLLQYLNKPHKAVVFIACGSGYMLASGAATLFSCQTDKKAVALAGGDVMLSPKKYQDLFQDALVVTQSLLQGTFPTLGSTLGLPHCRQILYHLSHEESLVQRSTIDQ